jgi:GNAT superfamily N-acetyltransferase
MPTTDPALRRALAFLDRLDESIVDERRPWGGGTALLTPGLPKVWSANFLRLERPEGRDPEAIATEAEAVAVASRIAYTTLVVDDEAAGAALAPDLGRLGFDVDRTLVMKLAATPDPPSVPVEPATFADVAPSRRELTLELHDDDEELADQLGQLDRRLEAAIGGRWYAVRERGTLLARAWLLSDGSTAQVEDVATTRRARGRGLARAVVSAAARAAVEDEHGLVFLITSADETTPELYRKLGFEPLGLTYRFVRAVR